MLRLAEEDKGVITGAAVGSLALGGGDRWSDLDLTFAVVDEAPFAMVLDDWTRALGRTRSRRSTSSTSRPGRRTYRVLLLTNALQFDLSMTPASPSSGRPARDFTLLFGEAGEGYIEPLEPPLAADLSPGW